MCHFYDQHRNTYAALRQSINQMLIIFLKNSVDSKTKDKLSMETHKHAPLFRVVVVDFSDDFVDELFRGLKILSVSTSLF